MRCRETPHILPIWPGSIPCSRHCGCRECHPGTVTRTLLEWPGRTKLGHGPLVSLPCLHQDSLGGAPEPARRERGGDRGSHAVPRGCVLRRQVVRSALRPPDRALLSRLSRFMHRQRRGRSVLRAARDPAFGGRALRDGHDSCSRQDPIASLPSAAALLTFRLVELAASLSCSGMSASWTLLTVSDTP
jgi:hypothetical protein